MSLLLITAMFTLIPMPAFAQAVDYRFSGYGGGMGLKEKKMNVTYKGYKIRISGYGKENHNNMYHRTATKKIRPRTYTVSSKCLVGAGGHNESYKAFLKNKGKKGRLDTFIDVHVKNNKVIYLSYGC